jgi:hypothetical protein
MTHILVSTSYQERIELMKEEQRTIMARLIIILQEQAALPACAMARAKAQPSIILTRSLIEQRGVKVR